MGECFLLAHTQLLSAKFSHVIPDGSDDRLQREDNMPAEPVPAVDAVEAEDAVNLGDSRVDPAAGTGHAVTFRRRLGERNDSYRWARQISFASGRALEILGHAIEYLADEYALSSMQMGRLDSADPRVQAVQLLMAANREVYFSCPEAVLWPQRLRRVLRRLLKGSLKGQSQSSFISQRS